MSRFASANSDNAYLTQLILSGPFTLDDLVVDDRDPFAALYLIQASAGANGSISPSTNIFLEAGGSQVYAITPDQFFHVADVLVDQVSVGAVHSYAFSNVTSDHEIEAVFAPDLAAHDTPHWWLHEQNPGWANDFDAAALNDIDGDTQFTWEEYLADTDPHTVVSHEKLDWTDWLRRDRGGSTLRAQAADDEGVVAAQSRMSIHSLAAPNPRRHQLARRSTDFFNGMREDVFSNSRRCE